MNEIKVFAPATVANIGCGYDTMGFAVSSIGEEIILSKRDDNQLVIKEIKGANLSMESASNVATIAIQSMLNKLKSIQGFDISIIKHFKPGSGLGSSASSAAGGVYAANELLGRPFKINELLPFALEGEAYASKCYHADNVAPSLLGGLQVIRSYDPLDVFRVDPKTYFDVLIIFPDVEIKTAESKKLLPTEIPIEVARNQWGNVAGLIHAFHSNDTNLLKSSISDFIAEPIRKDFIPKYEDVKRIVMENGTVGFNISGSGPSMFALFDDLDSIASAANQIEELYNGCGFDLNIYKTKMSGSGCKVIS